MNREMTVDEVMKIGDELRRQAIASASVEDLSDELRKQAIASAPPEERLAGLAPEERLAGLTPEEMARLLAQVEALLAKKPDPKPRHRKSTGKQE